MSFSVVGNRVTGGDGKIIEAGMKSHREATHAAQEASKSGASVAIQTNTVFAEIALDFGGAQKYVEILDGEEAKGKALKDAFSSGASEAELGALSSQPSSDFVDGGTVQMKKMDRPLRLGGIEYKAGDYFGRREDGSAFAVSASEFNTRFRKPARGSTPSQPTRPSDGETGEEN